MAKVSRAAPMPENRQDKRQPRIQVKKIPVFESVGKDKQEQSGSKIRETQRLMQRNRMISSFYEIIKYVIVDKNSLFVCNIKGISDCMLPGCVSQDVVGPKTEQRPKFKPTYLKWIDR